MPGKGAFKRCVKAVSRSRSAADPRAVCASQLSKTMGRGELQKKAAAGRKRAARKRNIGPLPGLETVLAQPSTLSFIEKERKKVVAAARKNKSKRKRNPRNPVDAAQDRYESFHGRPSEELLEIETPVHEHSVLSGIGELRKLVVVGPGRIGRVTIKGFGKNRQGQPAILSQNEAATQLFIDGGDQSLDLSVFGIDEPFHEMETLGKVRDIYYFTTKDHLGRDGGTATYHHRFGTMSGGRKTALPDLLYDTRNKLLSFSGGGYTLPDEGIDG